MRVALVIALLCAAPLQAQEFFTLKGHGGPIMDIDVSPSGQIATASFDNSVGLWDGETPLWQEGHRAAVNVVTFWGDTVISAGDDNTVRTWPDGGVLGEHTAKVVELATTNTHVASASWDARIGLWSKDGQGTYLSGHRQGVNSVVFSSDGKTLYSASVDGTIRLWDVETAQEKQLLAKHGFGINKLVLNEAKGWLAYGASDGGTRIIDPVTAEQIADFTLDRRPILSLAYDGAKNLAVGDGQGYIMVIDTEKMAITHDFRAAAKGPIWALAFSPNGQNLHAGGIEDIVYSWPLATLTEHGQMSGETRSFLEDPETLPNGERQFKRKCSICHTLTGDSARKAGPSLHKLFGRRAGTVPDYAYSDILEGSEIVWSAETINGLFDEGPDHYIPGTKMPMQRIAEKQDRDDLIAYLRVATNKE
ncbi:MAG: c-type cytochrome [Paracoccaceae bacterium]